MKRRIFLQTTGIAAFYSLSKQAGLLAAPVPAADLTAINIIIPRDFNPFPDEFATMRSKLTRATLDLLQENFSDRRMPVWKKPFADVDLEKRVSNIVYWVLRGIQEHRNIYPVDPAWIMAQIMKESYFYEFAVSRSLAVGICQFTQPTALEYGMACAGLEAAHQKAPYRRPELALRADDYYRLRRERRNYRRRHKPAKTFKLDEALRIIRGGKSSAHQKEVTAYLAYLDQIAEYDRQVSSARDDFREYLRANVDDRSIFNDKDLKFILGFDERFTYRKPAYSMVKMLARALRARNGNILAASIGYNAGLSSTLEGGMYKPYGKIPAIEESTNYISHILIHHFEIVRRMG